jgi:hypothetical protein
MAVKSMRSLAATMALLRKPPSIRINASRASRTFAIVGNNCCLDSSKTHVSVQLWRGRHRLFGKSVSLPGHFVEGWSGVPLDPKVLNGCTSALRNRIALKGSVRPNQYAFPAGQEDGAPQGGEIQSHPARMQKQEVVMSPLSWTQPVFRIESAVAVCPKIDSVSHDCQFLVATAYGENGHERTKISSFLCMTAASFRYPPAVATRLPPPPRHDRTWISISDCIARLTVLFAFQRQLLRVEGAWLAGVPYWDAKIKIGAHILEDAQHAEALLKRLHELKAASAEHKQIAGIEELVFAIANAGNGDEWLRGLYTEVKPWLVAAFLVYLESSDPLMDAPTHEIVRRIVAEQQAQIAWFSDFTPAYSAWEHPDCDRWTADLRKLLAATSLDGETLRTIEWDKPQRLHDPTFGRSEVARRDATFQVVTPLDFPEAGSSFEEKRFLVFYHHCQEIQFAESLGAILFQTAEMPWAFHHDLARHLADEVRHAKMGETRLAQLGVALNTVPIVTRNYDFRRNLDPIERFCLMTLVLEAGGFENKRANLELFESEKDHISALYESYDIRDEMLHTNLGHLWVPIMLRVYHDSRSLPELIEHCRTVIGDSTSEYTRKASSY